MAFHVPSAIPVEWGPQRIGLDQREEGGQKTLHADQLKDRKILPIRQARERAQRAIEGINQINAESNDNAQEGDQDDDVYIEIDGIPILARMCHNMSISAIDFDTANRLNIEILDHEEGFWESIYEGEETIHTNDIRMMKIKIKGVELEIKIRSTQDPMPRLILLGHDELNDMLKRQIRVYFRNAHTCKMTGWNPITGEWEREMGRTFQAVEGINQHKDDETEEDFDN
jgi:hypothetical protein